MHHHIARQWTVLLNSIHVTGAATYHDHITDVIVHHVYPTKLVVELRGIARIAFGEIDISRWGNNYIQSQLLNIYRCGKLK